MICKCGYNNQPGAQFCGYCGISLKEKKKKSKVWLILLIAAVLIAGVLLLIPKGPFAKDVVAEIDAIGTVTVNSHDALVQIQLHYDELSDTEKRKVTNYNELTSAFAEYERQIAAINNAKAAVNAIGTIDTDSEPDLINARQKYEEAVPYDLNGELIDSLTTLENAETAYQQLLIDLKEAAFASVEDVVALLLSSKFDEAEDTFHSHLENLLDTADQKKYADNIVEQLCCDAEEQFNAGAHLRAFRALENVDLFQDYCDQSLVSRANNLLNSFSNTLNQNTPKNGTILDRTYDPGRNTMDITAGAYDTVVKLELAEDTSKYVIVYVKANQTTRLNILNGVYNVKYTCGPVWFGNKDLFGPDATFILMTEAVNANGYTSGYRIYWNSFTWTIREGYGTSYGKQNMKPSAF